MTSIRTPRARDLGIPFDGQPGPLNAITDVAGVTVGACTIVDDRGARTGVTALFPAGRDATAGVSAAVFAFNGTGELTGAHQIREYGGFFGPVLLTGTLSVGAVSDAYLHWVAQHVADADARFKRILPVVGETWDGNLNDSWGFHVRAEHVVQALESAASGPVAEGNIGGGTGMICHGFKGGTGTASRVLSHGGRRFTVGALVQANHGQRDDLLIAGVPAGRRIQGWEPELPGAPRALADGSIIVVLATDAPLHAAQLERVAKRATIGLARAGGFGDALSGDIFLAFSTAMPVDVGQAVARPDRALAGDELDDVFHAAAWATEEAIVNAMVAARTMVGADGLRIHGLPHEPVVRLMQARAGQN